jgi:excisionase family DNA binding protein
MIAGYATTSEAAKMLNVVESRIRQLVIAGDLKAVKVGTSLAIRQSSIDKYKRLKNGKNGKRKAA